MKPNSKAKTWSAADWFCLVFSSASYQKHLFVRFNAFCKMVNIVDMVVQGRVNNKIFSLTTVNYHKH